MKFLYDYGFRVAILCVAANMGLDPLICYFRLYTLYLIPYTLYLTGKTRVQIYEIPCEDLHAG